MEGPFVPRAGLRRPSGVPFPENRPAIAVSGPFWFWRLGGRAWRPGRGELLGSRRLATSPTPQVKALDAGAGWGGRLTALRLDDRGVVQEAV
jgi:hypothetical protein